MAKHWRSIVVVIADPHRKDQAALAKAGAIAARCGARLTLLNTFMVPNPAPAGANLSSAALLQATAQERKAKLTQLARTLHKKGVRIHCAVEWDAPSHEAVVRYVLTAKPDLVVTESHHHNPLARMFLANTDWELIRACPCPVWFVRSRALPSVPKVIVAVDPRHTHAKPAKLDDRLLGAASNLTRQIGGAVSMLHVYQPMVSSTTLIEPMRLPLSLGRAREFDRRTQRLLDELGARHGVKASNRILATGEAVHALPAGVRKAKADVLVMGAVSRSRLARPFIGNTAEKVIDHVDCDVLIVKPANFKTTVKRGRLKLPK